MLWQAIGAVHDLGRLHDIAAVLIRYGFGDQVRRIGLADAPGAIDRRQRSHPQGASARLFGQSAKQFLFMRYQLLKNCKVPCLSISTLIVSPLTKCPAKIS